MSEKNHPRFCSSCDWMNACQIQATVDTFLSTPNNPELSTYFSPEQLQLCVTLLDLLGSEKTTSVAKPIEETMIVRNQPRSSPQMPAENKVAHPTLLGISNTEKKPSTLVADPKKKTKPPSLEKSIDPKKAAVLKKIDPSLLEIAKLLIERTYLSNPTLMQIEYDSLIDELPSYYGDDEKVRLKKAVNKMCFSIYVYLKQQQK